MFYDGVLLLLECEIGPQSKVPTQNHLIMSLLRLLADLLSRNSPAPSSSGSETDNSKLAGASSAEERVENMDTGEDHGRQTDEQVCNFC